MPSLAGTVPRQRWHFLRAELRWAYVGKPPPRPAGYRSYVSHTSAWLILAGSAQVRTAAGACRARAGQWLIAPPGERWQQTSVDCQLLSVCFVWQWIFGRELFPLAGGVKLESGDVPGLKSTGVRLAKKVESHFPGTRSELPELSGPITAHLQLQADFNTWLSEYYHAMTRHGERPCLMTLDARVEEAVRMLDRPDRDAPRPAALAKHLGLSPSQLNRLFLRQLGTTLHGYGERQKLASARMLLGGSGLSVKETSFRLGFLSPQHFSRWFRRQAGTSPTQLRRASVPMI